MAVQPLSKSRNPDLNLYGKAHYYREAIGVRIEAVTENLQKDDQS